MAYVAALPHTLVDQEGNRYIPFRTSEAHSVVPLRRNPSLLL